MPKGRGLFAMLYYHGYSLDVFGGRNSDPQLTNSLRIRDIVLKLDERFSDEQKAAKKEEAQIDFIR